MDIVVLAGGLSPERDVSLASGCLIANTLMENGHRVLLLDLYEGIGEGETFEEAYRLHKKSEYHFTVPESEPDLEKIKEATDNHGALVGRNVISVCQTADLAFLALHGSAGENGQLQAMFDLLNIKYTGTGYVGSLKAMDKSLSKQIMQANGIKTPKWVEYEEGWHDQGEIVYPCVVKPNGCGSSIGVSMVNGANELAAALKQAERYEIKLIIEEKIEGREFSVGILAGRALPIIEIIPKAGFYNYQNKYQAGLTEEICPARLTEEVSAEMQKKALQVHRALGLGTYSRIDFLMDKTGEMYCLEANTLPGMTPTSLLPQEAKAAGLPYDRLCETLAGLALSSVN